jgi:hypothetical protein
MSPLVRRFFAVIVGCAAAISIVRLLEQLANRVTMPAGLNPTDIEQVKIALERGEFPFASLALVLCGWHARIASFAFTVIFTAFIIRELTLLPHPTWMWIGGALGVPLVALGAAGESITVRGL